MGGRVNPGVCRYLTNAIESLSGNWRTERKNVIVKAPMTSEAHFNEEKVTIYEKMQKNARITNLYFWRV